MSGVFQVGSVVARLNPEGDMVCAHRQRYKEFEPESLEVWNDLCSDIDVLNVADVGAYTGLYSIIAALQGCGVSAFEPHSGNFKRLVQNCMENRVEVKCFTFALGCPKNGHSLGTFAYNSRVPLTSGGGIMGAVHYGNPPSNIDHTPVDIYRLDDVAGEGFEAIKIDVEGGELDVLRGATRIISENKPAILLECLSEQAHQSICSFLEPFGYGRPMPLDKRNFFFEPET